MFFGWFTIAIGFPRSENIALCNEAHGEVQRKGKVRNGTVRKGDTIYHGDKLITGENGFVSFMNIYEKTIVKIYENSVVKVLSDRKSRFSRSELVLFGGKVIVEMDARNDRHLIKMDALTASNTEKVKWKILQVRNAAISTAKRHKTIFKGRTILIPEKKRLIFVPQQHANHLAYL